MALALASEAPTCGSLPPYALDRPTTANEVATFVHEDARLERATE